jgi:hypothetical protein
VAENARGMAACQATISLPRWASKRLNAREVGTAHYSWRYPIEQSARDFDILIPSFFSYYSGEEAKHGIA